MRFRTRHRPVPYLNRRDQLRMLTMLGLLMLVVIAMRWAARPSSWYWLTGRPDAVRPEVAPAARDPLDFSVRGVDDEPELRPGEFIVPAVRSDQRGQSAAHRGGNGRVGADTVAAVGPPAAADEPARQNPSAEQPAGAEPNEPDARAAASQSPKEAEPRGAAPDGSEAEGAQGGEPQPTLVALPAVLPPDLKIPRELLADIEDRTLGVLKKEKLAHDWILAAVRKVPAERLEQAARRDVGFVALMAHPDDFRGELIRVDGLLGRVARFSPGPNDFGLEQLYEAYILTHESPENPIRFVCTSVPRELLPPQQGLREFDRNPPRVTAVGYFFKLYGYRARKGPHVAPLILGARLVWHRPQPVQEVASSALYWFLGFIGAILLVLGVVMWQFHRSDRQFQQTHLKRFQEQPENFPAESISELESVDPASPSDDEASAAPPQDEKTSRNESGQPSDDTPSA